MHRKLLLNVVLVMMIMVPLLRAEDESKPEQRITGTYQVEAQSYQPDTLIGATKDQTPAEKVRSNGFLYLNYSYGNFNAGMRYENYLNPILGIDESYKGNGIGYRFAEFNSDFMQVTAGNFYEQFGSGMIFRAYEERALGFDNSVDGLRVKIRPIKGIDITGLIGKQRFFWSLGEGIVRGADLNVAVNDIAADLLPESLSMILGGSFVSKYQADQDPNYNLPQNVMAYSGRMSLNAPIFNLDAEYGYKYPDPSAANRFNFNPGNAFLLTASYFPSGLGISVNFHRTDNMDFRSDRNQLGKNLLMNFMPPLTKQHIYRLATLYPYATQLTGEVGWQAEGTYTFDRGSLLGGEYGTTLNLNYSQVNNINKTTTMTDSVTGYPFLYDAKFFDIGKNIYFRDINMELSHKWSDGLKTNLTFINLLYDKDVLENNGSPTIGKIHANIIVADLTVKINDEQSIRWELQHMWAKQDSVQQKPDNQNGNWAMILAEYTIAPSWYFSLFDEYNYGNTFKEKQLHYLNASVSYVSGPARIQLSYGRQRGGLLCVGGVCRPVPASNGIYLSISSSF